MEHKVSPEIKTIKQRIIGFVLGDGYLSKVQRNGNSRLVLHHSVNQKEYLNFKIKLLKELGFEMTIPKIQYSTLSNGKEYATLHSESKYLPIFKSVREKVYPYGRKTIRSTVIENINEVDLALWFLDDGGIQRGSSSGVGKNNGLRLSTECFDKNEHEIMQKYLKRNFGLTAYVNYKKGQPYLYFNIIDSMILIHKCREILLQVPSMYYKWQSLDIIGAITGAPDNSESLTDREKATRLFIRYLVFDESENNPDNEVLDYYETFETFKQAIKTSRTKLGVKDMTRIHTYLEEQCTYVCRGKTPWIPWEGSSFTDKKTPDQGPSSIKVLGGGDENTNQITPTDLLSVYGISNTTTT